MKMVNGVPSLDPARRDGRKQARKRSGAQLEPKLTEDGRSVAIIEDSLAGCLPCTTSHASLLKMLIDEARKICSLASFDAFAAG